MPSPRPSCLSPRRLAEAAVARPGRVLAIWGRLVVIGFLLIGGLLGSALSSEGVITSNPESTRAEELIDERLPQRDEVDGRRNLPATGSVSIEADGSRHGMSCDHCAASVTEEVQQVDGVAAVVVDLEAGRVTVHGQGFSDEAVRAAVDEAGYEVVGA